MQTSRRSLLAGTAVTAAGLLIRRSARGAEKSIVIGMQNDRTGPTQIVGNILGPATHHYIDLVNKKGGLDGYRIEAPETDTQYQVPPAIEEYEHVKQHGFAGQADSVSEPIDHALPPDNDSAADRNGAAGATASL